jgi:hypothetical protein
MFAVPALSQFGKKEPTEAEKRAQSMDAMFAKAKLDDDDEPAIKGCVFLACVLGPWLPVAGTLTLVSPRVRLMQRRRVVRLARLTSRLDRVINQMGGREETDLHRRRGLDTMLWPFPHSLVV